MFKAANNTAVMADISPNQRGVVSGLLNRSRNLGLITGASLMGSVFAFGSGARDDVSVDPEALAAGMQLTFTVAAVLLLFALAIASAARALSRRDNSLGGGGASFEQERPR